MVEEVNDKVDKQDNKEFDKEQNKVGENKEVILKRKSGEERSGEEDEKENKEKKLRCCIIPCTGTGTASSRRLTKSFIKFSCFSFQLACRSPPFIKMGAEQYLLITLKAINH